MPLFFRKPASSPQPANDDGRQMAGMGLMILATLTAPGSDTISKLLSHWMAPLDITFWRFVLQTALIALIVRVSGTGFRSGLKLRVIVLLGALAAGTLIAMIWAVSVMPVATTIAIFFVQPLILTLFSVWFLGEPAGWRRFAAIGVGFAGALIVIRPSWADFGWAAVLPVGAAVCIAGYMTVVRKSGEHMKPLAMQVWVSLVAACLVGIVLLGLSVTGIRQVASFAVPVEAYGYLGLVAVTSTITFVLINQAFRLTPAGTLAPFQYLEIVSATALGYLVFGHFPDSMTWLGTAIILGSGLYVFHRERRAGVGI